MASDLRGICHQERTMTETVQAIRPNSAETVATREDEASPAAGAIPARRPQVVIVGGGFAGIAATRALKRADADIILVDRRNHHIFQPLLYQVATAVLAPSEIAAPIRQLASEQKNLSVMLAEVTGVNFNSRSVDMSCPEAGIRKVQFDYLVIAARMHASY